MIAFILIPLIPLLFYLVDGFYEKNLPKGILHIGLFTIVMAIGISLLYIIGWTFALCAPLLLFTMLCLKPKNQSKEINSAFEE